MVEKSMHNLLHLSQVPAMQVLREQLTPVFNSEWISDFSRSSAIDLDVLNEEVDYLGHMNNAVYVNWLDQSHLVHLFSMGITADIIKETGCALVVRRTDLTYLAALRQGDVARVGSCITSCDGRLRMQRQFQIVRTSDRMTSLRGTIDYVAVDYRRGKPVRMPAQYAEVLVGAIFRPERPY